MLQVEPTSQRGRRTAIASTLQKHSLADYTIDMHHQTFIGVSISFSHTIPYLACLAEQ